MRIRIHWTIMLILSVLLGVSFLGAVNVVHASPTLIDQNTENWGGYSIALPQSPSLAAVEIQAEWKVPAITCTVRIATLTGIMTVWVGMSGPQTAPDLERAGTAGECINGKPQYWAWYQSMPQMSQLQHITADGDFPIAAGDRVHVTVTNQGNGNIIFRLSDDKQPWQEYTKTVSTHPNASAPVMAEWIVEDMSNDPIHAGKLPRFSFVALENCTWNGNAMGNGESLTRYNAWYDVDNQGEGWPPRVERTLDMSPKGTGFIVNWNHF